MRPNSRRRTPLVIALLAGLSLFSTARAQDAPELILHNAVVWTVDDDNPWAEAVAIRDGKLMAVGSDADVLRLRGADTRVIDLKGNLMVPGFIDNHTHFSNAARFHEFNIMAISTQEEFVQRVRGAVARIPEGERITGGLWGAYDEWAIGSAGGEQREPFTPDMSLVEEITANHPMFINKFDSSEFAVNKAALRAAGLDPENPQAEGAEFVRDANGRPTGIVRGARVRPLFGGGGGRGQRGRRGRGGRGRGQAGGTIPPRRIAQTRHALQLVAEAGVTSLSDMSDNTQLEIYRQLREQGDLTVRVRFRPPLANWEEQAAQGIKVGSGDEWIRFGAVKGHIDGIMGQSSARFFEPYSHDANNRGRWRTLMVDDDGNFVEGQFLGYMQGADAAGLQLTVHAIGDEANHLLMNYLEELDKTNGKKDRRFRLVHAQVIAEDDMKRLGDLRIVAEVQPFHLSDDMRWMEERIGHERCKGAYAFKSIVDNGAVLSFGTDWPGTSAAEYPINPMLGIFAAVTRQTVTGQPEEGWFPDEKISVQDAIKAYTWGTAYASFEDDIKGTITTGKLADLTVLDHNILDCDPAEFLETKALYTIVGGRIVFQMDQR
jgi:predicted amidohydrolase YtcJ